MCGVDNKMWWRWPINGSLAGLGGRLVFFDLLRMMRSKLTIITRICKQKRLELEMSMTMDVSVVLPEVTLY